jgi:hypothetical protein
MHQQLWGYKVEWKSVSRGTGGKKVEYHWSNPYSFIYQASSIIPEADSHSATQKIPQILWNPKAYHRVQRNPPVHPILSNWAR